MASAFLSVLACVHKWRQKRWKTLGRSKILKVFPLKALSFPCFVLPLLYWVTFPVEGGRQDKTGSKRVVEWDVFVREYQVQRVGWSPVVRSNGNMFKGVGWSLTMVKERFPRSDNPHMIQVTNLPACKYCIYVYIYKPKDTHTCTSQHYVGVIRWTPADHRCM